MDEQIEAWGITLGPLSQNKTKLGFAPKLFNMASISALLTMLKPLTGSQLTVENSERDGNTRPPDLPLEKSVCRSGSNS